MKLPDPASLHHRRLDELFFNEHVGSSNNAKTIGRIRLERVHSSPNIYVIDDFLCPTELAHLQKLIDNKPRFHRSFVGEDSHLETSQRTSTFLSITKQQDAIISAIETKAASTLLGCFSTQTVEPLQLVRYLPGQFFGVHHDLGDYDETTQTVQLPPKSLYGARRRLVTLFCYLNTVENGGETHFPQCNLRVQPHPGRAVLFANVLRNGLPDERTLHAGEPPLKTTKYGLNIWIGEE